MLPFGAQKGRPGRTTQPPSDTEESVIPMLPVASPAVKGRPAVVAGKYKVQLTGSPAPRTTHPDLCVQRLGHERRRRLRAYGIYGG